VPEEPASTPAPTGATDQAQRFRDATEKVRQRTELTAKTFGGLGTAAISALGIAKFADVFPWAPGQGVWVCVLITSFLVMIGVVGLFAWRLWHASERIVLRSDAEKMSELDGGEKETVKEVYRETARLNLVPTLRALEARAHRLYRIANRVDDANLAKKLIQRANDIAADIHSVEARAGLLVVRRRAAQAFRDRWAILAFIALALAVVGFGISADRLESERAGLTKVVKDCAEAKKAAQVGGIRGVPEICKGSSPAVASAAAPATQCCQLPSPVDPSVTPAKGTAQKAAAASEALRAAANLATTLVGLGASGPASVTDQGPQILHDFLQQVGFPLTEKGISGISRTLWNRFAVDKPPRLPAETGETPASQPINLTVVLRDRRSPIQVVGTTPPISAWPVFGKAQQPIRLTVIVRDRRSRTQIIRIPPSPDDG
jgi:hypothetical protein